MHAGLAHSMRLTKSDTWSEGTQSGSSPLTPADCCTPLPVLAKLIYQTQPLAATSQACFGQTSVENVTCSINAQLVMSWKALMLVLFASHIRDRCKYRATQAEFILYVPRRGTCLADHVKQQHIINICCIHLNALPSCRTGQTLSDSTTNSVVTAAQGKAQHHHQGRRGDCTDRLLHSKPGRSTTLH